MSADGRARHIAKPTRGTNDAAQHAGFYEWPVNGQTHPKVQIITVEQFLAGDNPDAPPSLLPYLVNHPGFRAHFGHASS